VQLTDLTAEATTAGEGLSARVFDRLDARLEHEVERPVAVALSGGGDSMALLDLAGQWAGRRGRRLLAITVDHGLNPDSGRWNRLAAEAAAVAGADWHGVRWTGPRPVTGLPAAARAARHALIADAARAAGARVVLFAHTLSDVAEADWMRARGSTVGKVRVWSPSPAWPEGRGLMLLRPLLSERRESIRAYLGARGLGWVEDPGNVDIRFGRSRARQALAKTGPGVVTPVPPVRRISGRMPVVTTAGMVTVTRTTGLRALAAAAVCAGGGSRPPRGTRLDGLAVRLVAGEDFTAVMCGARIVAQGRSVTLMREAGEYGRRPVPPLVLKPGIPAVWDGRYELTAAAAGWQVVAAAGRLASLSADDRRRLDRLPAAARGTVPVLIRDGGGAPVLAGKAGIEVRALVGQRLALALDQTTHETGLGDALHGAMARDLLFSG
tara:strand:- start:8442 stop:9755 length:1314 start_codon:yes stop_codon:yes gene_type:complete